MSLSQTQIRKAAVGTTVCLSKAPFVRFQRTPDNWTEVPRAGITPRTMTTRDLFLLGVDLVNTGEV